LFTNTAPVCHLGITHVFVGTYELPAELEALGRVPAWLRVYLGENRSGGVSVLPPGREDASRLEFQRLPKIAPALPLGSS
jgi:hypothetical protein